AAHGRTARRAGRVRVWPGSEASGAPDDDVGGRAAEIVRGRAGRCKGGGPRYGGVTAKTVFIPASRCSAMWQWIIHIPGFVTSSSSSTTPPTGTRTVSFHA